GARAVRARGDGDLRVARRRVVAGDHGDPGSWMRQRLLDTPPGRVPPELARTVQEFCEPVPEIRAAYVGLTELTRDFHDPEEQLAVAFELAAPVAGSAQGGRELRPRA